MREGTGTGVGERAAAAAADGDWQQAFDLLRAADADGVLDPADLPVLAEAAYAAGRLDVTIETWERAHASALRAADDVAAAGAAVRVAMHLLFDTALMAPVRGWLARAERLLEGRDEGPAHAWLGVVRAYERMLSGDVAGAVPWARMAVDVGATCDPAACAIGRVASARLAILGGDAAGGLALLDEAGVAVASGELDPLSTGVVYCELVCTLQGVAQYDAAEQWTEAMERWCRSNAIGSLHGRCRVHRAEILRLRGSCHEAEREVLAAYEELRPYLRRELGWPLDELGRIRLRTGDLAGAEDAFLGAHGAGWDPGPGLALLRLAHGDGAGAVTAIRDAIEHPSQVPSKERPPSTDLQRVPLLEAQVEIEVAAGDVERARSAADELGRVAVRFGTGALVAGAVVARARVLLADGDAGGAEAAFAEAVRRWDDVGAPYEAAHARLGLAAAHRRAGDEHRADLEDRSARRTLAAIAAPATADGVTPAPPAGDPRVHVLHRRGDYWVVIFEGRTAHVRDLKGVRYVARLLADPGHEHHVLDLVAAEAGAVAGPDLGPAVATRFALGDAGPVLDPAAKEAYRRRLAEIDEDLDEARALGDDERAAQADAERDLLVGELARAFGLGGRDRRAASASERARVSVTRAVRQAVARLAALDPVLGAHLDHAVRTGTYCAYDPDPGLPARWEVVV